MAPSLNMYPNRPGSLPLPPTSIGDDYYHQRLPHQPQPQPPTPTMPRQVAPPPPPSDYHNHQYPPQYLRTPPPTMTNAHPHHPHLGSAAFLTPPHTSYVPPPTPSVAASASTPSADYARGPTPPSLQPYALPPIAHAVGAPPLPALPPAAGAGAGAGASGPDLSQISRGPLDVPAEDPDFVMSPALQEALRQAAATPEGATAALHGRVIKEATAYADGRKGIVRDALKRKQRNANLPLSPIDKGKLRSRREAKVHRVKERCFEKALKDAIMWFIEEQARVNAARVDNHRLQQHMPRVQEHPLVQSEQPLRYPQSHPMPYAHPQVQQSYPNDTLGNTNHNRRP